MKIDIKQKICNTRYCVGLPSNYDEAIKGIVYYLKDILTSFISEDEIKLLCCYSYDIKSNTIKNKYTNRVYIILDMHLFDYYIDFFYAYKNSKNFCENYIYKYLSEIYFSKGYIFDSVYFDELYQRSRVNKSRNCIEQELKFGAVSILFVLLHEILHLKPEIAEKNSFTNLFNKNMKATLSNMYLEIRGNKKKLIDESYCDFTSIYLLCNVIEKKNIFNISKSKIFEICLSTLLSILFYDLLNNIQIKDVDTIVRGEIFDRFIISSMFAYGFGFPDIMNVFLDAMQMYTYLLNDAANILSDMCDSVSGFKKRKNLNDLIENRIQREEKLKKDIWIEIL